MDEGTMVVNIYELHTNCEARAQTVVKLESHSSSHGPAALPPEVLSFQEVVWQDTTHSPNLWFAERVAWTKRARQRVQHSQHLEHAPRKVIGLNNPFQRAKSDIFRYNMHCIGLLGKFYRKPPYFMVKTMGFRLRCSLQSNESHPRSRDSVPHSPRVLEAHPSHRRERANTPGSSHHGAILQV